MNFNFCDYTEKVLVTLIFLRFKCVVVNVACAFSHHRCWPDPLSRNWLDFKHVAYFILSSLQLWTRVFIVWTGLNWMDGSSSPSDHVIIIINMIILTWMDCGSVLSSLLNISSALVVCSFVLCPAINANWSCDTLLFIVVCWTDCHTDMHSSNSINSFYKSSRRNSRAAAAAELSCLSILSCPAQEVKEEQSNRFLQLIASLDST